MKRAPALARWFRAARFWDALLAGIDGGVAWWRRAAARRGPAGRLALAFDTLEGRVMLSGTPVAGPATYSIVHGRLLAGALGGSDPDGRALTYALSQPAGYGQVTVGADGTFEYRSAIAFVGTDSFRFIVQAGADISTPAAVQVSVTNHAPVAADDGPYAVAAGQTLGGLDLVGNDADADGDPLQVTIVQGASHGSLSVGADGRYSYSPWSGYAGADAFTYRLSDGAQESGVATVTLSVGTPSSGSSNRQPVAASDSTTNTGHAQTISVLGNDSDPDGDALTVTGAGSASYGSVSYTSAGVTYTPYGGYSGSDSFRYTISDGRGGTSSATVTISGSSGSGSNRPPVAVSDNVWAYGGTVVITVLGNDYDPDGDTLTVTSNTSPSHGTLSGASGSYTYTPYGGYSGSDSFRYTIGDGRGGTSSATVNISVSNGSGSGSNRPPVAASDSTTNTGAAQTLDVRANDSDPDGDPLAVTGAGSASYGAVSYTSAGVTYTPYGGYRGSDSFTYTIGDGKGGSQGPRI